MEIRDAEDIVHDELVEAMYEAALDSKLWSAVVGIALRQHEVPFVSVYTPFSPKLGLQPVWSTNADPEFVSLYAERYAHTDVLYEALLKRIPSTRFTYSWADLLDQSAIDAWDGYWEGMKPRGVRTGYGLMVNAEDHLAAQLQVYSPETEDRFATRAKARLRRIESHFARAFQIHWHLLVANEDKHAMRLTLDMFRTGVAWLSSGGAVLHANAEMCRIFDLRDGLSLQGGRLSFSDRRGRSTIKAGIDVAERGETSSFFVERPSGQSPLRVSVVPLPAQAVALRLPDSAAIVFVSESPTPTASSIRTAASIYGLTAAETRVLGALVCGRSCREVSDSFGTSIETVRTQIKAILGKFQVERQADLIRLVATLPQIDA